MRITNPIQDVAQAVYSACLRDLSEVEYHAFTPAMKMAGKHPYDAPIKKRRPEPYDIEEVQLWQQTWGSTALGFGGLGGQATTTAHVIVAIGPNRDAAVYFGGRFAYLIEKPNATFRDDVFKRTMADVSGAKKRYEEKPSPESAAG